MTVEEKPKKYWKWKISLVLLPAVGFLLFILDSPPAPVAIPQGQITAFLLDGDGETPPSEKVVGEFLHRFPIIEQKVITNSKLADEIRSQVNSRFSYSHTASAAACFNPHIGFRIGDSKAVDVLVCTSCNLTYFYECGKDSDSSRILSDWGNSSFRSLSEEVFPGWKTKADTFHEKYAAEQDARERAAMESVAPTDSANHVAK